MTAHILIFKFKDGSYQIEPQNGTREDVVDLAKEACGADVESFATPTVEEAMAATDLLAFVRKVRESSLRTGSDLDQEAVRLIKQAGGAA